MTDCTDCGACCMNQVISLTDLERWTTPPELMDSRGNLKSINGHCILFDPETRRCTDYENRPTICRDFVPGCGRCKIMQLWADVELSWFTGGTRVPAEDSFSRFAVRVKTEEDCVGRVTAITMSDPSAYELAGVHRINDDLPSSGW